MRAKIWPPPKAWREMAERLERKPKAAERLNAELAEWNAKKSSLERGTRSVASALLDSSKQPTWRTPRNASNAALERAGGCT